MQESRIDDYWNIDGSRVLSDSWTGVTQFTLLSEKPPEGWPGGWGHQGMFLTGGGLASGPEPACVQTSKYVGWHTQGVKDELTSCRGAV